MIGDERLLRVEGVALQHGQVVVGDIDRAPILADTLHGSKRWERVEQLWFFCRFVFLLGLEGQEAIVIDVFSSNGGAAYLHGVRGGARGGGDREIATWRSVALEFDPGGGSGDRLLPLSLPDTLAVLPAENCFQNPVEEPHFDGRFVQVSHSVLVTTLSSRGADEAATTEGEKTTYPHSKTLH